MKTCSECGENKPLEEFYSRSSRCKKCHNEYTRQHYKDNIALYVEKAKRAKQKVIDYVREAKSSPCMDCSKSYPYYVMDFDHRENKEFNISEMMHKVGLTKIKAEIAKCDVVCSNCHRERTFQRAVL